MNLTHIPEARAGMLIRKPAHEVFEALADPAITTRSWYSKSTGPMTSGAHLEWSWESYGVSATIRVKEVEKVLECRPVSDGFDFFRCRR